MHPACSAVLLRAAAHKHMQFYRRYFGTIFFPPHTPHAHYTFCYHTLHLADTSPIYV